MKKFRLGGGFALAAFFFASVFLGSCDDDYWEYPSKTKDSSLTVDFTQEYRTDGSVKVTLKHGDTRMDGIVYTDDGSIPDVEYDDSKDGNLWYRGNNSTNQTISMVFTQDCTLSFLAYRVDDSIETVKYGNVVTKEIDVAEVYTFYYDEPDTNIIFNGEEYSFVCTKTFTHTRGYETFKGAHYEMSFFPDEGTWELYVLHNGSVVKDTDHNTNYIAKGVFYGDCFDGKPTTPASGTLRLCTLNSNEDWFSISLTSSPSFQLPLSDGFISLVTADY